ncbi:heme-binding protein [Mycobacterium sp.]|uniref:heme-binding protein n=1 Tax=Mycobacterium sp. TaxID=1785 RepID=UPI003BAD0074
MIFVGCFPSRIVAGGIVAAALSATTYLGSTGLASAEPAPAAPNCTAADVAGVSAGVAAATSVYLFTHPEVNDYFTSLKGQSRGDMRDQLQQYMDSHPQVHAELRGIRQPLTDLKNRCGEIVAD